ncbi:MAG: P13 family porin [Brevinematales bacterium]|nr:P13 family porin [Brevinematales bacterium]
MKQFLVSVLLVAVFASIGFSAGKAEIQLQLQEKTFLNPGGVEIIASMVGDLTMEDKMLMYTSYKKDDAAVGFVLNFLLPGIGIGNYVIGDTSGGTITLVGSLVSWAAYVVGMNLILSSPQVGVVVAYTGLGGACFFMIRGLVSPFTYVGNYNDQLKKSLLLTPMTAMVNDDVFHVDLYSISF